MEADTKFGSHMLKGCSTSELLHSLQAMLEKEAYQALLRVKAEVEDSKTVAARWKHSRPAAAPEKGADEDDLSFRECLDICASGQRGLVADLPGLALADCKLESKRCITGAKRRKNSLPGKEHILSDAVTILKHLRGNYHVLRKHRQAREMLQLLKRSFCHARISRAFSSSDAPQTLTVCDTRGIYLDCNEAAARFLHCTRAAMLNQPFVHANAATTSVVGVFQRIVPALIAYGAVETRNMIFPALGVVVDVIAHVNWDRVKDASEATGYRRVPKYAHFLAVNVRPVDLQAMSSHKTMFRALSLGRLDSVDGTTSGELRQPVAETPWMSVDDAAVLEPRAISSPVAMYYPTDTHGGTNDDRQGDLGEFLASLSTTPPQNGTALGPSFAALHHEQLVSSLTSSDATSFQLLDHSQSQDFGCPVEPLTAYHLETLPDDILRGMSQDPTEFANVLLSADSEFAIPDSFVGAARQFGLTVSPDMSLLATSDQDFQPGLLASTPAPRDGHSG